MKVPIVKGQMFFLMYTWKLLSKMLKDVSEEEVFACRWRILNQLTESSSFKGICMAHLTSLSSSSSWWNSGRCLSRWKDWKTLYATSDEACLEITRDHCGEVRELSSTQEEADTRTLLNTLQAAKNTTTSIVWEDVLILCLGFTSEIPYAILLYVEQRGLLTWANSEVTLHRWHLLPWLDYVPSPRVILRLLFQAEVS